MQDNIETRSLLVAFELLRRSVVENTHATNEAAKEARGRDGITHAEQRKSTVAPDNKDSARINEMVAKLGNSLDKSFSQTLAQHVMSGGPAAVGAVSSVFSAIGNSLLMKFAAVLGPLALLASVVQSAGSGFQVLATSVKLFAATISPILLPVVAVLAAALIDLSDKLWSQLLPKLESWYTFIVGSLLPALRSMADAFISAATVIKNLSEVAGIAGDKLQSGAKWLGDQIHSGAEAIFGKSPEGNTGSAWNGMLPGDLRGLLTRRGRVGDTAAGAASGGVAGSGESPDWFGRVMNNINISSKPGGIFGSVGPTIGAVLAGATPPAPKGSEPSAMQLVIQEMRRSNGPQASFSSLTQASKNAQLAALNQSPLELKMLERLTQSLETLEKVEFNTRRGGVI